MHKGETSILLFPHPELLSVAYGVSRLVGVWLGNTDQSVHVGI